MADAGHMGSESPKAQSSDEYSATQDNRRGYPRLGADGLMSSIGLVLDLSKGGLRVLAQQAPKEREFTITLAAEVPTEFEVRVARATKVARRKFEVGLEFCELSDDQALALKAICQTFRHRRVM